MKIPKIKNLVLSGGGVKGFAICGAIEKLNEKINMLTTVKNIYGSSIGACIGLFLSIGLSPKKIRIIFDTVNLSDYQEVDLKLLMSKFGLDEGNKIISLVKATMTTQGFDPNITFEEFGKKSKYNLTIVGTNINKSCPIYFSATESPNIPVCQALRISGGYPIAFTPVEINGDLCADGAIVCPLASELIPKKEKNKTLGIAVHRSFTRYDTDNVFNYMYGIISCILDSLLDKNIKSLKHVIQLSYPVNSLAPSLTDEEKQNMWECGKNKAEQWVQSFDNSE